MEQFKLFLEQHREWAQEPEFLQYYALPYLPDPKAHPSFNALFEPEWSARLETQLTIFLATYVPKSQPKLLQILNESKMKRAISAAKLISRPSSSHNSKIQELEDSIHSLKNQLIESTKREKDLHTKLKTIRTDYHQLLTVSTELVATLISAMNQEPIDPSYLGGIVKKLGSFRKATQELSQTPLRMDTNVHQQAKAVAKPPRLPAILGPIIQQLDFNSIQKTLVNPIKSSEDKLKIVKLIQSLRAFISTDSVGIRKENLEELIKVDFLGMNEVTLVPYLLHHTEYSVREECAKLLNSISSHCTGRGYITKHEGFIIQDMVQSIKVDSVDSMCRQHLLGALQKLSLRRIAQSVMNESETITFLLKLLNNLDNLSEYSIEYGSALLMNLCLRSKGLKEACSNPELTLKILNELIDHENVQVKTYVNGCLYSLFSDKKMREHAQNIGMESQLQYLKQMVDESLVKQIDFVIERLGQGNYFVTKTKKSYLMLSRKTVKIMVSKTTQRKMWMKNQIMIWFSIKSFYYSLLPTQKQQFQNQRKRFQNKSLLPANN
jgi:LisH domain-containing protein ARMC9